MEIVGKLLQKIKVVKSYHFGKNSLYLVLKIELLLTELSNFERKAALKNSAFLMGNMSDT